MERKFKRGVSRPGMAAQLRETVSQVVKETTIETQRHITEPLDYENYVIANMTILRNDPHRELLLFPLDDIQVCDREQANPYLGTRLEQRGLEMADALPLRVCLETYTARLVSVKYNYDAYAGTYLQLPKFPLAPQLSQGVSELSLGDTQTAPSESSTAQTLSKCGFLLRAPDTADRLFAKAYKRRFAKLRQGADGSYVLEFYKDSKLSENKGAIPLDLIAEVVKLPRRNKPSFELRTAAAGKTYVLATETDQELTSWLDAVTKAVVSNREDRLSILSDVSSGRECTPPAGDGDAAPVCCDTLRGLDQTLNPQLLRYAHETDFQTAHARAEDRVCVFQLYSHVASTPLSTSSSADHLRTEPFSETRGLNVLLNCVSLQFRLQTSSSTEQIEPYVNTLCLYDARQGRKISEDFHFDVNSQSSRGLLPRTCGGSKTPNTDTCLLPDLSCAPQEWISYPRRAVFNVQQPHEDVFVFVRVEKVLQGATADAADIYSRPADAKYAAKVQHQARQACDRQGSYRMPFVWSARPLFRCPALLDVTSEFPALYRHEPNRLSEDDIVKLLQDWKRPEKMSRLATVPGSIVIEASLLTGTLENRVSSSLVPLRPFPVPPSSPPALQLQPLPGSAPELAAPHSAYTSLLYVYPRRLKYDAQKTFKARNIACRVELRSSDEPEHAAPIQCFFGRPGQGASFTGHQLTSVLYHETSPSWCDELKLALPLAVTSRHHLLFTFYHVSCQQKPTKRAAEQPDCCVGYAWIPLLNKSRLNLDTQTVAVASHLPSGYLSVEPLGMGKGFAGPEIRWLDGQRPLFKVACRLVSTVYTTDQHLHSFLLHSQRLHHGRLPSVYACDTETAKQIKALHAIDASTLICFLPTVLNQLMNILVGTDTDDVVHNACRLLSHIISSLHQVGRQRLIDVYVRHVMNFGAGGRVATSSVHEALCRGLCQLLQPAAIDFLLAHKLLRYASTFFDIIVKSMTLHLTSTGRIKMQRHERFSSGFCKQLEAMLESFHPFILNKYKELPLETREGNVSIAALLKRCLSVMDRGFVFRLISSYLQKFGLSDPRVLWEYKFEFLQVICSHEHFVQLNLPLFVAPKTSIKSIQDFEDEYMISETFCSRHYLVGLMLHELRLALSQIPEVRRLAIHAVRDLIVKHAYDDRYQSKGQQCRIATLYFPLVGLLLENLHRMEARRPSAAAPPTAGGAPPSPTAAASVSRAHSSVSTVSSRRSGSTWSRCSQVSTGSLPRNTLIGDGSGHVTKIQLGLPESTYLAYIAGQSGQSSEQRLQVPAASSVASLASSDSDSSCSSTRTATGSCSTSQLLPADVVDSCSVRSVTPVTAVPLERPSSQQQYRRTHRRAHSTAHDPSTAGTLFRYDKLLAAEVRDLLVCFVHVAARLPDELLTSWWQLADEQDVISFFNLVQLALTRLCFSVSADDDSTAAAGDSLDVPSASSTGQRVSLAAGERRESRKSSTLPARIAPPAASPGFRIDGTGNATIDGRQDSQPTSGTHGNSADKCGVQCSPQLMGEVTLTALDLLSLYCCRFSDRLSRLDGLNSQMALLSDIYISLLHPGQNENTLRHVFAAMRMFVKRFGNAIYLGAADLCGRLVYCLLRCCNSALASSRHEACALIYLLMRGNFETTGRRSMTRVHLQVIIKVSQLLGESVVLDSVHFYESLSLINSYANSDKAMRHTSFVHDVKDVTRRVRSVLVATSQLKDHQNDPQLLVELQHSLANSYASMPQLRETWLRSMAAHHQKRGSMSEAAMCELHVTALMAEYLRQRGEHELGCRSFHAVSANVVRDETCAKFDIGAWDICYSEHSFVDQLKRTAEALEVCERHELVADLYDVLIPILRRHHSYSQLADVHQHLYRCYLKIGKCRYDGRRLLGTYYRVVFYGQSYFDKDHDREYVYKEPNVTPLSEVSSKLLQLQSDKFGADNVQLIMDSAPVAVSELDTGKAYIQVTHLTPYWDEPDPDVKLSEFQRNNNVYQFMYETPFTKDGGVRGAVGKQWKRRTVLTTDYHFPYLRTRIAVVRRQEYEISPIEVAIEEMNRRTRDLIEVTEQIPTDVKKLQLRLQGSVCVQVNAGPLAYASAFLESSVAPSFPGDRVYRLRQVFGEFVDACQAALQLNSRLRAVDQADYHRSLQMATRDMVAALSVIVGHEYSVCVAADQPPTNRQMSVVTLLSNVTGSSSV